MRSIDHIFDGGISPSAVHQADIHDCYFLSALASEANTAKGREAIRNTIKPNADGTCTVTFKGDSAHPISVSENDIESARVINESKWANIIETAYLKYNRNVSSVDDLKKRDISLWQGRASSMGSAIHLLTGHKAHTEQNGFLNSDNKRLTIGRTSNEKLRHDLTMATRQGDVVTANSMVYLPGLTQNHDSLPGGHVFSVLGYEIKTDTVTVRNPWKNSGDSNLLKRGDTHNGIKYMGEGVMAMPFEVFRRRFNAVYIASHD